jgi:hypothetical protein
VSTKTLDRSRPHGTVHPPYEGSHFEQDGFPFDAQGQIVESLLTDAQKAALAKKPAAPKPPKPETQTQDVKTSTNGSGKPPGGGTSGDKADADDFGVNLEQWLRDPESANFKDVRQAVKDRYSVWMTAKADVVVFLVNEKQLLPVEEIDPSLRALLPKAA